MRTLIGSRTAAVVLLLLAVACAPAPEEPPPKVPLTIGLHDIALQIPPGWLHLDHGLEHLLINDPLQISVADMGPVTREGYLREINHALGLFREGQIEDATAHLNGLQLRSTVFSPREWDEISQAWYVAIDGGLKKPMTADDVELAYRSLLQQVAQRQTPALSAMVERIVPTLYSGAHREVAEQESVIIDGRPGIRLTTWDRLSHDHRRSLLLVLNNDNMLVIRMGLGESTEMQPVFDALIGSLEINPRPELTP